MKTFSELQDTRNETAEEENNDDEEEDVEDDKTTRKRKSRGVGRVKEEEGEPTPKKKKKKKAATKVSSDVQTEKSSTGFNIKLQLSAPLAVLLGTETMSRPQVRV